MKNILKSTKFKGSEKTYMLNDRHKVIENRDRSGRVMSYFDTVYNERGGVDWTKSGYSPACPYCKEREVNAWIDGGKLRICKNKECPRYVE